MTAKTVYMGGVPSRTIAKSLDSGISELKGYLA